MTWSVTLADRRKLLVTGASGFVGSHLLRQLDETWQTLAVGRSPRPPSVPDHIDWQICDLADRTALSALPRNFDVVIHLAVESVPARYGDPQDVLLAASLTGNLLQHVTTTTFLYASSCLVYAPSNGPLSETATVEARGAYALTKLLGEQMTAIARDTRCVIARPFNHIGRGMNPDLLIPSLRRRLQSSRSGAEIMMRGNDSIRDYLDVEDIVSAYLHLISIGSTAGIEIFNVCSGHGRRVSDVVRQAAACIDIEPGPIVFEASGRSGEDVERLVGDPGKILRTGWRPTVPWPESLRRAMR